MGREKISDNLCRGGRSPGGGTDDARRGAVSLGSVFPVWETSDVCTTPCTTTSVPAAGKLRLGSGGGGWEGSGGVAGLSITLNASEFCSGVALGCVEIVGRGLGSWLRATGSRGVDKDGVDAGDVEDAEDVSVTVPSKGIESGWETSMVEEPVEEGPAVGDVECSITLVVGSSCFALPFESGVGFNGCGEDVDGMDGRDG
jgi:hypothetical protein